MSDEKELRDYLFKEIEIVQPIINRMGHNSFLIKGWAITLVVIVMVFRNLPDQAYLAIIPLAAFWCLDAYYLRQERLYRDLYKWLVANRLKTDKRLLSMDTSQFNVSFWRTLFSSTLVLFYVLILVLVLAFEFAHGSASCAALTENGYC